MISGPSSDNQKSEPPGKTDWLHQNSNWDPRKTEKFLRKHSEFYRVGLEECIGVSHCPADWNGHIGSRNQFVEPIFPPPNSWSKHAYLLSKEVAVIKNVKTA